MSRNYQQGQGQGQAYYSNNGYLTSDTEGEETDKENSDSEEFEQYAEQKEAVIVFMDVDSFDVQVRGRKMGFDPEVLKQQPFIVINEHHVITAVNYPAKACGIQRAKECTLDIARQLCPQLQVLEIPNHLGKPDSLNLRKSSDDIYESIIRSLQRQCEGRPLPKIERASKDEFYVEVTNEVFHRVRNKGMIVPSHQEVQELKQVKCIVETPGRRVSGDTMSYRTLKVLTNKSIIQDRHKTEALLMHGAVMAYKLLQDIQQETGFVLSAGISSNKLLSKLGCSYNKPEAITVLPHSSLGRVAKYIKVSSIPGLGGKLGKEIEQKLHVQNMGQLGHKNRTLLQRIMKSQDALLFHQLAVGYDPTKVVGKKFCSSLKCGITFSFKTRKMNQLAHFEANLWNRFLEMRDHVVYECLRHGPDRVPKSLRLEIRTRKGDLKIAFGETAVLEEPLRDAIHEDARNSNKKLSHSTEGSLLSEPWKQLHDHFWKQLKQNCKIDVTSRDLVAASAAIRKVSEINLIANFNPADGEED